MAFMLNERAQRLLKVLIERYIAEGQPVGSRTLAKYSGLDLSPASIRNVMADLEDLGFIISPHTSAGRVPTPRGYRFFVDTLLTIQPLKEGEIHQLEGQLHPDDPQRVVSNASQLLSELTQFAAVVRTPRRRSTAFRHVEFLKLSDKRILLIIVATDGDVQNRIILTDRAFHSGELREAANFLNRNYAGQTFEDVRSHLRHELTQLKNDMSALMQSVVEAGSAAMKQGDESYVLSGESNLLHVADLSSNMEALRKLFDAFEKKTALLKLLDVSSRAASSASTVACSSVSGPISRLSAPARQHARSRRFSWATVFRN